MKHPLMPTIEEKFEYLGDRDKDTAIKFTETILDFLRKLYTTKHFTRKVSGITHDVHADIFAGYSDGKYVFNAGTFGCYLLHLFSIDKNHKLDDDGTIRALNEYCRTVGWSIYYDIRPIKPFNEIIRRDYKAYLTALGLDTDFVEWAVYRLEDSMENVSRSLSAHDRHLKEVWTLLQVLMDYQEDI